jgi:glycosyltransferase involved in cell wall biosynthesis
MNTCPVVSIIVPCYNQGCFLSETLECISKQEYTDWECLIINDGSSDDTEQVADKWVKNDSRFRYFKKVNGGISSARNVGIKNSQGKYIQFIDADDLIEAHKLASQCDYLEKNSSVGIVYGDMRYFPTDQPYQLRYSIADPDVEWLESAWLDPRPILEKLLENNIMGINCPLFRVSVFQNVGLFTEGMHMMEDWFYFIRCAIKGVVFQFIPSDNSLALVRIHARSATQNFDKILQGTYEMTLLLGPLLSDSTLRRKNFNLGIGRITFSDRLNFERELFRLFWSHMSFDITIDFLNTYLVRHPTLRRLFTSINSVSRLQK